MSTIDLFILGILQEKAMNAYEIAQFVEVRQIHHLMKISPPSIYKNCKKLFQSGYLTGEKVREGENPEKVIFKVSKEGKKYFIELMQHFSSRVQPFYFDFNTFIWNMNKLPPEKSLEMLKNLRDELAQIKAWIIHHEKEVSAAGLQIRLIVKQGRMIICTLLEWAEEALVEFKKEYKKIKK